MMPGLYAGICFLHSSVIPIPLAIGESFIVNPHKWAVHIANQPKMAVNKGHGFFFF